MKKNNDRIFRNYRIEHLGKQLQLAPSVLKLALRGPQPNIEMDSIRAADTPEKAIALLEKSKSTHRSRAIVQRQIEVSNHPSDLTNVFCHDKSQPLLMCTDLRVSWTVKMMRQADEFIQRRFWGGLFELRKHATNFLRDYMTTGLYSICFTFGMAMQALRELEESRAFTNEFDYSGRDEYWMFALRAAELADRNQAIALLAELSQKRRFDPENPACRLLVTKAVQEDCDPGTA